MNLRQVLERQMTEKDMLTELMAAARIGDWLAYHTFDSRHSQEGFPDCWFLRGGEMLWWELKTLRGKTTPGQERMLAALQAFIEAHGLAPWVEARVVRPADVDGCLRRLLRRDGLPDAEIA